MDHVEAILIGLPGPTHHYGGLSRGNLASQRHAGEVAHPRAAARQCLALAALLRDAGQAVAVLPPLLRPDLAALHAAGFGGEPGAAAAAAASAEPALLDAAMSSAAMWAANAGTVIPAGDSGDGRCHLLPANLIATPHRAFEALPRTAMLRALLEPAGVVVHDPLPASPAFADEGAANHTRLLGPSGGVHVFVSGRDGVERGADGPRRYPARQSRIAQAAIARRAGLAPARCRFPRQNPLAIDAGAFHNDVVMVGHGDRVLIHEQAWCEQERELAALRQAIPGLRVAVVEARELDLAEAIASYLFNSQLVWGEDGWLLVAPEECRASAPGAVLDRLLAEGFVDRVHHHDLRQSMHGGGGPACLRLRLPLQPAAWQGLAPRLGLDDARERTLTAWIDEHYRADLPVAALADPGLTRAAIAAQRALGAALGLPLSALVPPGW